MRERTRLVPRTALRWLVVGVMIFPVLWMALVAVKSELDAIALPPPLFFTPPLENFAKMRRRDYLPHAWDNVAIAFGSTIVAVLIAERIPLLFFLEHVASSRECSQGLDMTGGLDGLGCEDQAARD
jgi:ABC-type spermidine/putrescine transport system permease subunit II